MGTIDGFAIPGSSNMQMPNSGLTQERPSGSNNHVGPIRNGRNNQNRFSTVGVQHALGELPGHQTTNSSYNLSMATNLDPRQSSRLVIHPVNYPEDLITDRIAVALREFLGSCHADFKRFGGDADVGASSLRQRGGCAFLSCPNKVSARWTRGIFGKKNWRQLVGTDLVCEPEDGFVVAASFTLWIPSKETDFDVVKVTVSDIFKGQINVTSWRLIRFVDEKFKDRNAPKGMMSGNIPKGVKFAFIADNNLRNLVASAKNGEFKFHFGYFTQQAVIRAIGSDRRNMNEQGESKKQGKNRTKINFLIFKWLSTENPGKHSSCWSDRSSTKSSCKCSMRTTQMLKLGMESTMEPITALKIRWNNESAVKLMNFKTESSVLKNCIVDSVLKKNVLYINLKFCGGENENVKGKKKLRRKAKRMNKIELKNKVAERMNMKLFIVKLFEKFLTNFEMNQNFVAYMKDHPLGDKILAFLEKKVKTVMEILILKSSLILLNPFGFSGSSAPETEKCIISGWAFQPDYG
jgi:hypothetical protein